MQWLKFLKIKKGEALAHGEGLDTNVWIIGVPELINRLEALLKDLMSQLGASEGTVFDAIGLSISGGSQPKMVENIKTQLKVIFLFVREHFRGFLISNPSRIF